MSKTPVWIIIRSTFDERIRPITLYWSELPLGNYGVYHAFAPVRDDAEQFFTKAQAFAALHDIYPHHGNESIMEIEVESIKVV